MDPDPEHFSMRAWHLCCILMPTVACTALLQPGNRVGSAQMILSLSLTDFEVSSELRDFMTWKTRFKALAGFDRPSHDVLDHAYRDDPLPQGSPTPCRNIRLLQAIALTQRNRCPECPKAVKEPTLPKHLFPDTQITVSIVYIGSGSTSNWKISGFHRFSPSMGAILPLPAPGEAPQ